ncbi:MAG: hypothetical protein CVT88_08050 [Candidatus Altiarchaeales archaeon HGW-Altiarchaeales-1]|nr:MAG: hypothetical protein CVT88_08050 [Candidatus Altiarchaeales archaeon HGW-Altiarchaeales-1]
METLQTFKGKEKFMSVKEHLVKELGTLEEKQLYEIEEYITFLKFRSRFVLPKFNEKRIAQLYVEFAKEYQDLAEEGIADYTNSLTKEDEQ